jgi:hypothetical protein
MATNADRALFMQTGLALFFGSLRQKYFIVPKDDHIRNDLKIIVIRFRTVPWHEPAMAIDEIHDFGFRHDTKTGLKITGLGKFFLVDHQNILFHI